MIKKIAIAQLRKGMYVCGNNRKWLETPFFRTKFLVVSDEQIAEFGEYCQFVYIDTEKGCDVDTAADSKLANLIDDPVSKLYFDSVALLQNHRDKLASGKALESNVADKIVDPLLPYLHKREIRLMDLILDGGETRSPARQAVDNCILGVWLGQGLKLKSSHCKSLGFQLLLADHDHDSETKSERAKMPSWLMAPDDVADVVSTFNSLREHQFSHEVSPVCAALEYMQSGRMPHLNAYLVKKLIETVSIYPVGSIVELNTGQLAVVAENGLDQPSIRLRVVTDAGKKLLQQTSLLDLPRQSQSGPAIVGLLAFDDPIIGLIVRYSGTVECIAPSQEVQD